MYKDDYNLTPSVMSMSYGFTALPWSLKPIWGFISDSYPLFGYRRKSYLISMALIRFLSWLALAFWVKTYK